MKDDETPSPLNNISAVLKSSQMAETARKRMLRGVDFPQVSESDKRKVHASHCASPKREGGRDVALNDMLKVPED